MTDPVRVAVDAAVRAAVDPSGAGDPVDRFLDVLAGAGQRVVEAGLDMVRQVRFAVAGSRMPAAYGEALDPAVWSAVIPDHDPDDDAVVLGGDYPAWGMRKRWMFAVVVDLVGGSGPVRVVVPRVELHPDPGDGVALTMMVDPTFRGG